MPDPTTILQPDGAGEPEDLPVPLGGTRAEAIFRLQIGVAGLVAVLMMIGLANIVMDRAKETEATTVPEAAATVASKSAPAQTGDPLADAGVVPSPKADDGGAKSGARGDRKP
jgi:hypothetical protein